MDIIGDGAEVESRSTLDISSNSSQTEALVSPKKIMYRCSIDVQR